MIQVIPAGEEEAIPSSGFFSIKKAAHGEEDDQQTVPWIRIKESTGAYNTNSSNRPNSVSIMHQNIQCIRNKIIDLNIFLNTDLDNVDIVCFSEHWLNEHEYTSLVIPNYNLAGIYCRKVHKNGGVAILVKNSISFKNKPHTMFLNEELHFEHIVIELTISKNNLLIVCLYRSPRGSIEIFLNKLEILLDNLGREGKTIVLCGDFNINFLIEHAAKENFLAITKSFNLHPIISTATRTTSFSQTCIDQIFANITTGSFSSNNIDTGISDHNAIFFASIYSKPNNYQ